MFEKISQVAEQMAKRASRRQFLGRLSGGAMAAAAAMGGLLAHAAPATRLCGPNSVAACQGKNVGDSCSEERGSLGQCQDQHRDGNCFCSVKGPSPRR